MFGEEGAVIRAIVLTLCLSAAIAGNASPASADTGSPPNVHATLSGAVTDVGGDCCFLFANFAGSGVLPMLGQVTFKGFFVYLGSPGQTQPCELLFGVVPCEQQVFIAITADSGRTVTIRGDDFWMPPTPAPAQWSWAATGDLTGSGIYTTTLISGTVTGVIGQPLSITLGGTLQPSSS